MSKRPAPDRKDVAKALEMASDASGLTRLLAEMLAASHEMTFEADDHAERPGFRYQAARGAKERILERLLEGPLPFTEYHGLCSSRMALCHHVCRLRQRGARIATSKGAYVLAAAPEMEGECA